MITHKIIMVRPDETIDFFSPPDFFISLRKKFLDEKKILNIKITLSDDQLTKTVITEFHSEKEFKEYVSLPELDNLSRNRRQYHEDNGVVELVTLLDEHGNLLNFIDLKNKK